MAKWGPIIIAEDDPDDQDILRDILQNLEVRNEIIFFENGQKVYDYLLHTTDKPFLIFSDVNLPGMGGIELKQKINNNAMLREKGIPFVYLTTSIEPVLLKESYERHVQGYFIKGNNMEEVEHMLRVIIEYWTICKHPNNE